MLEDIELVVGKGFIRTTVVGDKVVRTRIPRKKRHFCIKGDACIEHWGFLCKESNLVPLPKWLI